jgi:lia operon protein LiaG
MKTIKSIFSILLILVIVNAYSQNEKITIHAKKFEIQLKDIQNSKLELLGLAGDITITTNKSNKVVIEANGIKELPERAKGLKRVGAGGEDNTGVGLNIDQSDNTIRLTGAVAMRSGIDYKITVPENLKVNLQLGMFNNGNVKINGLNTDLELDVKNSDMKLTNITGPTVISSLSGDIEIVFSKVNQSSPFSIKAISGDIDLSLPDNTPANLELSSMSGGVYTDFDIKSENEKAGDLSYIGGGTKVRSKINGGGVKVAVSAISGDIYLRKKK